MKKNGWNSNSTADRNGWNTTRKRRLEQQQRYVMQQLGHQYNQNQPRVPFVFDQPVQVAAPVEPWKVVYQAPQVLWNQSPMQDWQHQLSSIQPPPPPPPPLPPQLYQNQNQQSQQIEFPAPWSQPFLLPPPPPPPPKRQQQHHVGITASNSRTSPSSDMEESDGDAAPSSTMSVSIHRKKKQIPLLPSNTFKQGKWVSNTNASTEQHCGDLNLYADLPPPQASKVIEINTTSSSSSSSSNSSCLIDMMHEQQMEANTELRNPSPIQQSVPPTEAIDLTDDKPELNDAPVTAHDWDANMELKSQDYNTDNPPILGDNPEREQPEALRRKQRNQSPQRSDKEVQMAMAKAKLLHAKAKLVMALKNHPSSRSLVIENISQTGPPELVRWTHVIHDNDDNDDDSSGDESENENDQAVAQVPDEEQQHLHSKKKLILDMSVELLKKKLELKRKTLERKVKERQQQQSQQKPTKEQLMQRQNQVQHDREVAYWKRLFVQQRNLLCAEEQQLKDHQDAIVATEQELQELNKSIQECNTALVEYQVRDAYLEKRILEVSTKVLEARKLRYPNASG